ncbi:Peptide hydrolase [Mycena sanguinolenta]|uniref:Peptide hydrolase n=1 Tax=Mycena sanguinolenta TaxID=230812 RepID=A0A8H6YS66_9AGAR|nr:Peptide hydrolase [Mycena sanguinolenta]
MQIVEGAAKVLGFRAFPVTILAVLVYVVLFGAVHYGDRVPAVPSLKDQHGLDLPGAYADLHRITERPHPVLSHANDMVHDYILARVRNISSGVEYIEVYDDIVSNASWTLAAWGGSDATVIYNEATNILVKIQGSDPEYDGDGGVLFSAHYDSVSTASGATDDGMGVVTLMQLIEYLAKNQPKRTAVFNINNGEEDGLCGAFTFLKHPWANLTDVFLNLEGASSGGRPLLFRGTTTPALRSFHVPHPHGNVLSADAFSRGVIRSGTDYSVYTGAGMAGLDLAFYRGRSKYHTKYDAIPFTEAQEQALWNMMESAQGSGLSLLNDNRTHGTGSSPVYFDLFGVWLVLLSIDSLLITNVVLLIVGPAILIVLVVADAAILYGRSQNRNGHVPEYNNNLLKQFWTWLIAFGWLKGAWMWAKFWVAILVTLGLQALLMFGYLKLNPFIVYAHPTLVLVSSFTLTYLSLVFVITPSSNHLPEKQKHIMFLQTYILTWLLLVGATIAVSSGIGGVYFVTAWNISVLLACAIGCVENMLGAQGSSDTYHVHYAPLPQRDDEEQPQAGTSAATEATETTPLIRPVLRTKDENGAIGWWIAQFILAVSVPVTLVAHIAILFMGATAQTLVDGSSAVIVYAGVAVVVFMMVLPVVPFTFKMHSGYCGSLLRRFRFFDSRQSVALGDISSPNPHITHVTTTLTGIDHYMEDLIIPKLPSAIGQNVTCSESDPTRQGLRICSWESTLLPSPRRHDPSSPVGTNHWMTASITRLTSNSARFVLYPSNTRGCRLYFDNKRITRHNVVGWESGLLPKFPGHPNGVNVLRLWSRTWNRSFWVDVEWDGDSTLQGRVACEWAEYESGSIGVNAPTGQIPAFEEALTFFPSLGCCYKSG